MVESDAISARDKLKNLTGDAYTSAFNDAIQGIATRVQAATKATDKEMDGFKSSITEYLSEIVQWGKKSQAEISKAENELKEYLGNKPTPVTESVDYVSMSFETLEKR